VKAFLAGAAPIPLKVIERLKALRHCPVINIYPSEVDDLK
jgi:hypothetical protein